VADYFLALRLQVDDGPSLRMIERGGTVEGAQEEGGEQQTGSGLQAQSPPHLTVRTFKKMNKSLIYDVSSCFNGNGHNQQRPSREGDE
jgi:hypothetical protein